MARIKLTPLKNYRFSMEMVVRTTDLNYGGHLGNDSLVSLLHEARVAFLDEHGLSETDCGGVPLIMGDLAVMFQGESFAGDRLRFQVSAAEFTGSGFRLFYRVTRGDDPIALAESGMVAFDPRARKATRLPGDIPRRINPGDPLPREEG